MSTDSRCYYVPHFVLPQITRCPEFFTRSLFPAFYPLALPLFTNTRQINGLSEVTTDTTYTTDRN